MNWTVILSIATAVIQALSENCPAESRENQRRLIRQPEERFKRRFEVRLQRECCNPFTGTMTRREWRENEEEILNKCYGQAAAMKDWEIDALLDGAA